VIRVRADQEVYAERCNGCHCDVHDEIPGVKHCGEVGSPSVAAELPAGNCLLRPEHTKISQGRRFSEKYSVHEGDSWSS